MKRFSARIRHNAETILRMCRVQYDTFYFGRKLMMAVVGFLMAIFGMGNLGNMIGIIFCMVGCWMLASLNLPARQRADAVKEALKGEYPDNGYDFYDKHFILHAQVEDLINYDRLVRLVEDDLYCYLFINSEAAFMVEKASFGGEVKEFKAFLSKATGFEWKNPPRLSTFNLKTLKELFDQRKAKGRK